MKIKPPETLEDYKIIKQSIVDLMRNPHCDKRMYEQLMRKLRKVNIIIIELESK